MQFWNVECKCGKIKSVRATHLLRGKTKRCKTCGRKNQGRIIWKGGEFISSSLVSHYVNGARKRNIPFKLTISELENKWREQNGLCAYTGQKLTLPLDSRDYTYTASIDRIDSKKPYELSNIEWVTKHVNFMKQSLSKKEFIEICKIVSTRFENLRISQYENI